MSFLEIDEQSDFTWLENWQKASSISDIIANLDNIDNIKKNSWPVENLSLGESLATISYLYELKNVDIPLPLALDSIVWTDTGLILLPSEHLLKSREVKEFANKVAIDAISKWKGHSPLLSELFKTLQSQGLDGIDNIVSKEQLKQWKLLRPIIPEYIDVLAHQFLEESSGNLITFTGLEGEGERLVISALIKNLRNRSFVVITVPAGGSYKTMVESLLGGLVKLIPRNTIKSILSMYDGNVGRILSKYTNITYKGPSGILIPQMEGYWIGLTVSQLLKLIDKPVAVIFENYIDSARKKSVWEALSYAKDGLFIRKDPEGTPIFPLMDPEEVSAIANRMNLPDIDPLTLYSLSEGKTSSVVSILRILHYLDEHMTTAIKDKFSLIEKLGEKLKPETIKYIAAAFGSKHTEIPSTLLKGINTYQDLLHIVESGLIDLYGDLATIADNHLLSNIIKNADERISISRQLIRKSKLTLPIIYHFLDEVDNLSDKGKLILLKLSGALLHKLRSDNLAEALELAWEMEKRFGDLLLEYPRYYLLIGHVFMLNGRRERGYEIFSAVRMFHGDTPWLLTHILYYAFPMLTNGIGWEEIHNILTNLKVDRGPCIEYLIRDSIIRFKLRHNKDISPEEMNNLHKAYKQCPVFIEHTFRYRDILMHIYARNKQYDSALSEAIKLKDAFTEKEPYLMAYGMFTTGMYLTLSGGNLWLATYYLERSFEYFIYYYNVEAFLAIGMAIQWKAQMLSRSEFEEYINTLLALIDIEGLILYDRDYIYLSIALAYHLYGMQGVANSFLSMVSKEVVFNNGGDITRGSMHLYNLLTEAAPTENLPYSEHYTYDMNQYEITEDLPNPPHLLVADMIKSGKPRTVNQDIESLTKLSKHLYKNGFKLLSAYIHALIGKKAINSAREIANFHFRRAKHLFDILDSKWSDIVLEEIEMSDPFYALAIKTAMEVEKGNLIGGSDATEIIEMFIETIRIMQSENEVLEQIITLIEAFTGCDNPISASTDFLTSALTIWGASRGWIYLESQGTPKLWIHINIQGTDEEDFLMLPMAMKESIVSKTGNFVGAIIKEEDIILKIYLEADDKQKFGKNHLFVLSRSGDALLHFLRSHI
ncbi:hypothetical protein GM182_05250 [bacterium 3DAC]|nr:hypothetical protein GM182_05250 [bacterium 3DAC]